MQQIFANNLAILSLGRQGENLVRQVVFDISDWESEYGNGTAELIYKRPKDQQPYPIVTVRNDNSLVWTVTSTDTYMASDYGECELRYYVGDTIVKSKTWRTWVELAMQTPSEEVPPEPQQGWVDRVLSASIEAIHAAERAQNAITKSPKIEADGNWYIWDTNNGLYIDTGVRAVGNSPYIGANGNWFVGNEDSGVSATGPRGPAGKDGADGKPGKDGVDGQDGYTPQKGVDYFDGAPGRDGSDGAPGKDGRDGANGQDGVSVTHEWIGTTLQVTSASGTTSANLKGKDGYTPVRGTDYWTEADVAEIKSYVDQQLGVIENGSY